MTSAQKEALREYAASMGEEHERSGGIFGKKKK